MHGLCCHHTHYRCWLSPSVWPQSTLIDTIPQINKHKSHFFLLGGIHNLHFFFVQHMWLACKRLSSFIHNSKKVREKKMRELGCLLRGRVCPSWRCQMEYIALVHLSFLLLPQVTLLSDSYFFFVFLPEEDYSFFTLPSLPSQQQQINFLYGVSCFRQIHVRVWHTHTHTHTPKYPPPQCELHTWNFSQARMFNLSCLGGNWI